MVSNIHRECEEPHSCPHDMGPRGMALHNAPLDGMALHNARLDGRGLHNEAQHNVAPPDGMDQSHEALHNKKEEVEEALCKVAEV